MCIDQWTTSQMCSFRTITATLAALEQICFLYNEEEKSQDDQFDGANKQRIKSFK